MYRLSRRSGSKRNSRSPARSSKASFPGNCPAIPGYELGALMIPARSVGGDFFTYFKLGKDRLGLVVGDVSDKGVPAALFMALTYSLIRAEAIRTSSPVQAFRKVNHHLLQMNCLEDVRHTGLWHPGLQKRGLSLCPRRPSLTLPPGWGRTGSWKYPSRPVSRWACSIICPSTNNVCNCPPAEHFCFTATESVRPRMCRVTTSHRICSTRTMAANRTRPAREICKQLWLDVQAHGHGLPQQDDFTSVVVKRLVDQSI